MKINENIQKENFGSSSIINSMNSINNLNYFPIDNNTERNLNKVSITNNINSLNDFHKNLQIQNEANISTKNSNESKKQTKTPPFSSEKQKIKQPSIELLINTINHLFETGKISVKFLKEKSETQNENSKKNNESLRKNSQNNENSQNFGQRCENPLCKCFFNSNKEKIKVVIKGLKVQEKILCENCCNAVENGQFCYYCNSIYSEKISDSDVWIECDYCHKWEHFECELLKGKRYSSKNELKNVKNYMCPICVNKKNEEKESANKLKKKFIKKKRKNDSFEEKKKKNKKNLRDIKSEKCSELLADIQLIESL